MQLKITRFVRSEGESDLKAFCDVCVGDLLLIRGVRVVQGRQGPFVSMPRQQGKNGKWYDSVVPLDKGIRTRLSQAVLEAYHACGVALSTQEERSIWQPDAR